MRGERLEGEASRMESSERDKTNLLPSFPECIAFSTTYFALIKSLA